MSRENVKLVRQMYDTYLSGDAEGSLAYFSPDVEADFSARVDAGVATGREELARVVTAWVATWDDYQEEIEEIHDLGDKICIASTQRGRGKGSGAQLTQRFASLYEIEEGVITRVTMYRDVESALKAAKASEPS